MSKAKEKKEVTTNQGKKHLFGSSEKSDFILNMSAESAQKLCGVYSIIAVLVLCVITIPYYFTQNIKYGMDESVNCTLYLNEKFIFFISAAVHLSTAISTAPRVCSPYLVIGDFLPQE